MSTVQETDHILEELLALPDETARRAFLTQPDIISQAQSLMETITARVDYLCRSEPVQSLPVADLGLLVAGTTGKAAAQGLAHRAKGHSLRAVGRFQEALPLYTEAVSFFKQAGLPNEEARTYLGEIAALLYLGNYAECFKRATSIRRRLTRLNDNLSLAKLEANLAVTNDRIGRYSAGLRLHNRAINLFEALQMPELVLSSRVNRANNLVQLNRFRQASEDYEAGRAFFGSKGMKSSLAVVEQNLGFLLFRQGRYNDALALQLSAREGFESAGQPNYRALVDLDLAECYVALGMSDDAIASYQQASQTFRSLNLKSEIVWAEIGRAQILLHKGQPLEAEQHLQTVVETYEAAESNERNQHALAVAWLYRAQARSLDGTELEEALALSRQARTSFDALKLPIWSAQSLLLQANLLRQTHRWAESRATYEAALGPVGRLKLPHLLYQLLYGYGRLEQAQAEALPSNSTAQADLLEAARQRYRQAAEQVETIRGILRPEEWRSAFMQNSLGAYEALIALCLRENSNPQRLAEALGYIERSKSRSLLDLLAQDLSGTSDEPESVKPSSLSPEERATLAARIEELRQELNWYYSQLHNPVLPVSGENQRLIVIDPEKIVQQLETREWELAKLLRRFRPGLLSEGAGRTLPATAHPDELARELSLCLTPQQNFIEYYVLEEQVVAFVVTAEGVQGYHELCALEQVADLQERLNFQANKFNLGHAYIERHLPALHAAFDLYLQQLYKLLLAPLVGQLKGPELIIAPHGRLHTLPFHALHQGERYLTEDYTISYVPSAAVLLHCLKQSSRSPEKLLALAVPDEHLRGVEVEVRGLGQFFKQSRLLIGPDATLDGLLSNLGWCDVLHLATHGVFREDNPFFSLLKLSDGWLSVHDVMGWRFRPALVTLSACQTGLTRPLRGDELLGLARGFLAAGAYALIVSLWSVDDEVTTRLMHLFYAALSSGQGRAEALRQAMLGLRSDPRYAHPHYWAAFVLLGQP